MATTRTASQSMGRFAWTAAVISLMSSMFLFALDNTILADVQARIALSLGEIEQLPWVSVAYPLGAFAVTLLVSNLFWHFDNKLLFLGGVLLFNVGSALCGAAPTMSALIVGRVVCGIGGTGLYIGAMNLLSWMTTEEERPMYMGIAGLSWGVGTILGPIVGGALAASQATWRWCFYINLCVGGVACPVYIWLLPSHNPSHGKSVLSRLLELDWVGAILNAGATLSLVAGIAFGGGVFNWSSGSTIGLLVAGSVLSLLFVVQQRFSLFTTPDRRIFPVRYLHSAQMVIFFIQTACGITATFIPLFFLPLYFQFVQSQSTFATALHLLPLVVFQVAGTILGGGMLHKVGYYIVFYVAGGILAIIGGALFLTVDQNTSPAAVYGYSVLLGFGAGLYTQIGYPVAQLKVSPAEIPQIVTFLGYAQIMGIVLALAISSSAYLNEATNQIAKILPEVPRAIVQQGITGTDGEFFTSIPADKREPVLNAIVHVIASEYGLVIAASGLTLVLALFMKRERLLTPESSERPASEVAGDKADAASS